MGAQESKLALQRGIERLGALQDIPLEDDIWFNLWSVPDSAEEVFRILTPELIRKLRDQSLENLEKLLLVVTSRLFAIRNDPRFPDNEHAPASELLNCIRILNRILPFVYEVPEMEQWYLRFWWTMRKKYSVDTEPGEVDLSVMSTEQLSLQQNLQSATGEGDVGMSSTMPSDNSSQKSSYSVEKPLMEELLSSLFQLLFCAGFTLPSSCAEKFTYRVWEEGVGVTEVTERVPKEFLNNRIEVLRLLMVILAYEAQAGNQRAYALTYTVAVVSKQLILVFLCSLITVGLRYTPTGWKASYNGILIPSDPNVVLSTLSKQLLLILLDFQPSPEDISFFSERPDTTTKLYVNQYQLYFSKLHRKSDFNFILTELRRLFTFPSRFAPSLLLPINKFASCFPETIFFFWQAVNINKRLCAYLMASPYSLDIFTFVQYYALRFRNDPSNAGLVRVCAFIVHNMSCEKRLCVKLNTPFPNGQMLLSSLRLNVSQSITHAEFLILSIYHLIAIKGSPFHNIVPLLLLTFCNIAPYVENLNFNTCVKIMHLVSTFSSPKFLLRHPSNHLFLEYLLNAISSIVENHPKTNPHLLYSILRLQDRFFAIKNLENTHFQNNNLEKGVNVLDSPEDTYFPSIEKSKPDSVTVDVSPSFHNDSDGSDVADADLAPSPLTSSPSSSANFPSIYSQKDAFLINPRVVSLRAYRKTPELLSAAEASDRASKNPYENDAQVLVNGTFKPSQTWLNDWFPNLQLDTILSIIHQFSKIVFDLLQDGNHEVDDIIQFLAQSDSLGEHPHVPDPNYFKWNEHLTHWFQGLVGLYIFLSDDRAGLGSPSLWRDSQIPKEIAVSANGFLSQKGNRERLEDATKSVLAKLDQFHIRLPTNGIFRPE
ncbi:dymeclin 3 [Schizosaccharomyces japonicus yFS275]|uniref:Dymeclin 3 n=1 Tax=Schizosaccharomyces japonicus (strain yFS275 / FY16936) TaxID=402676 RepID=B6K3T7_SCHJY|nr:dymeclin 3 [Schizosaccharomyces japonicus yFS275]EEB08144.2 dymeclin 3 [Schizosaccharomyces japonicus yFS275]